MLEIGEGLMPAYLNIYYSDGSYEPSNKWFLVNALPSAIAANDLAVQIASESATLQHVNVHYTRWEYVDAGGIKTFEGAFAASLQGTVIGEILPFKYCVLVRLASSGPARPSVKYFHGIGESSIQNGTPNGGFLTDLFAAGAAWSALDVADSDGVGVDGALFRSFTRRKKVRRIA